MNLRIDGSISISGAESSDRGSAIRSAGGATAVMSAGLDDQGRLALPRPLPSISSGGDLLAELTVLLTLASQSDRDAARQAQRAEDMLRTQQEDLKVQKLHEQADYIRAQGWAEGLSEIGQGICQVGAGTTTCVRGKLDWNDLSLAMSKSFAGAGAAVAGQYGALEKLAQADAEEAGANADRAGRGSKEASDEVANARDMLKKIASFYEQMLQAQSAAMNAAANWRA
ncbi:MAG TPA: hypothetical protein VJV79_31615 [Polyangiaceae bacterium]|nr:hypothetical protein [Polyangiaceae bacterium]